MNWVMEQGLATDTSNPYIGSDGGCSRDASFTSGSHWAGGANLESMVAIGVHSPRSGRSPGPTFGLSGWERLPENQYEPLIRAVAHTGPAAVSVSARPWTTYGTGIFDNCEPDATIDHAVTLIGYGTRRVRHQKNIWVDTKYWTIKNSWGNTWGENGNIHLLREEGNVHCGTDYQPQVGTGCDDGPLTVPVCGMCGILYDAVVPHFRRNPR